MQQFLQLLKTLFISLWRDFVAHDAVYTALRLGTAVAVHLAAIIPAAELVRV